MNDTIRKFGYPATLIHEYRHWVVLLRPEQVTLGSLVLACSEPVTRFSDVSPAAFAEMAQAIRSIETVLSDRFAYQKLNYLMLMMVDPDVHFHVIPRYADACRFGDQAFLDHGWPGPPALGQPNATDDRQIAALTAELRDRWPTV